MDVLLDQCFLKLFIAYINSVDKTRANLIL